ncbi:insulin-like growth factor binding protein 2, 36kDa [Columba livia]|uniref:Insulin-like growth factor binding protein 2, 36kDa n=1 Tax=Columba livia TaxID=8932 RepID=A0A2I0MG64_COLLI|nr:insulin-like growth factor binding protein 2, 36kDa [Columba livia]
MGGRGPKSKGKQNTLSPLLSLLSPRPKTVNTVSPASSVLLVPCGPAISPGVGCSLGGGKKGKEESPRLEHASPNESSSREKVKDEAAQAFKYPWVLPFPVLGHSQAYRDPAPVAGPGGCGLWVMVKLKAWFSKGFEGLLPRIP